MRYIITFALVYLQFPACIILKWDFMDPVKAQAVIEMLDPKDVVVI